jgi:HAD superfamily hydrolase (TIGR01509 family)
MRAVLFDLDGTLIDTWRLYVEAYQRTLTPLFGRPPTLAELAAFKPASELRTLHNAVGAAAVAGYHRAFLDHYAALHDRLCDGPYPGVAGLLAELRRRGLPLGIVTGKSRAAWEITAARCALGPFAPVVTDEDVRLPKPDPQGLRIALAALGAAPADCIYVGDSLADLGAAHAAGVAFAGVLWCKAPGEREDFAAAAQARGALACLAQPDDLLAHLAGSPPAARVAAAP